MSKEIYFILTLTHLYTHIAYWNFPDKKCGIEYCNTVILVHCNIVHPRHPWYVRVQVCMYIILLDISTYG